MSPPEDGFAKDTAVLQRAIVDQLEKQRDVIILAHSYGAILLTEALAATRISSAAKVLGIIFVAAMVPEDADNLATAMKAGVVPWVKIEVHHPQEAKNRSAQDQLV